MNRKLHIATRGVLDAQGQEWDIDALLVSIRVAMDKNAIVAFGYDMNRPVGKMQDVMIEGDDLYGVLDLLEELSAVVTEAWCLAPGMIVYRNPAEPHVWGRGSVFVMTLLRPEHSPFRQAA